MALIGVFRIPSDTKEYSDAKYSFVKSPGKDRAKDEETKLGSQRKHDLLGIQITSSYDAQNPLFYFAFYVGGFLG